MQGVNVAKVDLFCDAYIYLFILFIYLFAECFLDFLFVMCYSSKIFLPWFILVTLSKPFMEMVVPFTPFEGFNLCDFTTTTDYLSYPKCKSS